MHILKKKEDVFSWCENWRKSGERIILVPTMGYFHEGHASLMRAAREMGGKVVVTLFVNPTQFGPKEDLSFYPADLEGDTACAKSMDVDLLFAPHTEEIYDASHSTLVTVPNLSHSLCGISRPTHFQGVALVCLKLFMITQAHVAIFGQKDWQQTALIRRMVQDLDVPLKVVVCPTVREADGLAMSSRNVFLEAEEREQAPEIYKGLCFAKNLVNQGERKVSFIVNAVLRQWKKRLSRGRLDYLSVVDAQTLEPLSEVTDNAVMACAVYLGKARLLDNIRL